MVSLSVPRCENDVVDAVADALRARGRLEIAGGGSKGRIGRAVDVPKLEMAGLTGVVDYSASELVVTVRPGTLLVDLVALLADEGQYLAFDPFDHGPMLGNTKHSATIGGVAAAGVSGSGRISGGAARDHLLGFRAVSGRGEAFAAGGKVVKNVTGFDLSKLAARSWGRLFAMTELTFKVAPEPRERTTLMITGLTDGDAVRAMSRAMGSPAEVAAAAHFPAATRDGQSATIVRIQGFGPSVAARQALLTELLKDFGSLVALSADEAAVMWGCLTTLTPLQSQRAVWRICVAANRAVNVTGQFRDHDAAWLYDWAGGLIWLATDTKPEFVRTVAAQCGGHAALIRADEQVRAQVPFFHPASDGIAALETRIRRAFDPESVFETGRF